MKKYDVEITQEALRDMEAIYEYIASKLYAPMAAARQYDRLAEAILSLEFFPKRCAIMRSRQEYLKSIRRMVVGKYSVFYVISGDSVIVISVLYSASDIEERLHTRLG